LIKNYIFEERKEFIGDGCGNDRNVTSRKGLKAAIAFAKNTMPSMVNGYKRGTEQRRKSIRGHVKRKYSKNTKRPVGSRIYLKKLMKQRRCPWSAILLGHKRTQLVAWNDDPQKRQRGEPDRGGGYKKKAKQGNP